MTMGIQQLISAIGRLQDAFHAAVYSARDVDGALATMAADCVLTNVPDPSGGHTGHGLRRYLAEDVLPHLPADLAFHRVSRTVDQRRLVEEATVEFTHDRELPWLLPGVPPTGRRAAVLAISVVTVRHTSQLGVVSSKIAGHRTLWDHAGLLAQLRLSPSVMAPTV